MSGEALPASPGTLTDEDFRVVQITPPELPCSITFGKGVGSAAAGSADGLHLIVWHQGRIGREWRGRYAAYVVYEKAGGELPS